MCNSKNFILGNGYTFEKGASTVNQTTKKQHYIWRSYLAPWTNNDSSTGTIVCLRDNKIFTVSLMNIAHENYFYGIKELSKLERHIVYEMTIKSVTGRQREVNEGLNLYCTPFDLADEVVRLHYSMGLPTDRVKMESNQEFKNWNIEYIEKLHCQIESTGMQYMELIRHNDLSFWKIEKSRDEFSFFLCNQYFRTKRMRDSLTMVFAKYHAINEDFKNICPENMWLPLSLIFASNVGAHVTHDFSAVLLQAEDSHFIVGDQPVVNTYSTFNMLTPPNDMELFYPVTPHTALLLTTDPKYVSGQILKIGIHEVEKYNTLEIRASREQSFAKDKAQLEAFMAVQH